MILTVTLNPLLERRLYYANVNPGTEHRDGKGTLVAGGKGINVSRELNCLGVENISYTFLGGVNGKIIRDVLSAEGIKFTSVKTKDETRDAAVIIDGSGPAVTTYFRANSSVSKSEVEEFKSRLVKMIENCEIVVFAGSSPCSEADSIFPYGIELANKYDKISVCDTYGAHLSACYDSKPTVVHNNINEVEKSLGISLTSETGKDNFMYGLYEKGIKQVYLTDGERAAYASTFGYNYKIQNPIIKPFDATGSGDCFVAGIVYSWHSSLTFEEGLLMSSSLGCANAVKQDVCSVSISEADKFKPDIKIIPYGKRMKIVDVSPHSLL